MIPIYPDEKQFLKRIQNEEHLTAMSKGIIIGDKVIVEEGPMCGLEALIKKIDRHHRIAEIESEICGRKARMRVGLEIIRKIK